MVKMYVYHKINHSHLPYNYCNRFLKQLMRRNRFFRSIVNYLQLIGTKSDCSSDNFLLEALKKSCEDDSSVNLSQKKLDEFSLFNRSSLTDHHQMVLNKFLIE